MQLTIKQACTFLGISKPTFRKLKVPYTLVGKTKFYSFKHIEKHTNQDSPKILPSEEVVTKTELITTTPTPTEALSIEDGQSLYDELAYNYFQREKPGTFAHNLLTSVVVCSLQISKIEQHLMKYPLDLDISKLHSAAFRNFIQSKKELENYVIQIKQ